MESVGTKIFTEIGDLASVQGGQIHRSRNQVANPPEIQEGIVTSNRIEESHSDGIPREALRELLHLTPVQDLMPPRTKGLQ
jgi:hypothetical protein